MGGAPLFWFDDVGVNDAGFVCAQFVTISRLMPISSQHLHFRPNDAITYAEAAPIIVKLLDSKNKNSRQDNDQLNRKDSALKLCQERRIFGKSDLDPDEELTASELEYAARHFYKMDYSAQVPDKLISRIEFAGWLLAASKKLKSI